MLRARRGMRYRGPGGAHAEHFIQAELALGGFREQRRSRRFVHARRVGRTGPVEGTAGWRQRRGLGAAGDAGHRSGGWAGARVPPVAAPKVAQSGWRGKYGVLAQAPRKVKRRSAGRKFLKRRRVPRTGGGHKEYVVAAWSRCVMSRAAGGLADGRRFARSARLCREGMQVPLASRRSQNLSEEEIE